MTDKKQNIKVRWHPQYKPSAHKVIITRYRIYAYIGHPLLGIIHGSEQYAKTEKEAKKIASKMRNRFK